MAKLNFTDNPYVKWTVQNGGGLGIGKVLSNTESHAKVEIPTGLICDIAISELLESNEEEFSNGIEDIVTKVSKKLKKKQLAKASKDNDEDDMKGKDMADAQSIEAMQKEMAMWKEKASQAEAAMKEIQAKWNESEAAMKDMKSKCEALEAEAAAAKKDMEAKSSQLQAAEAQLSDIKLTQAAQARFTQLKEVDAVSYIAKSDDEAIKSLKDMDDKTFATILNVATAAAANIKKLTDQTQTSMSKSTDQTQTGNPKLTDQTAKAEDATAVATDALDNAEKDKDAALATAGSQVNNTVNVVSKFAESVFGRQLKKANTNTEKK